ncbi:MAG: peptidase [Candidatus Krumholzibacteriota bacterium]|nr:peptidase [Candidatus Krumholzibacteriota bacterium]
MKNLWIVCVLLLALGCSSAERFQEEVDAYLEEYNLQFQRLAYESSKAEWASNTMIAEGDTTNAYRTRMANEAFAAYTGSKENIEKATQYLAKKEKLLPLQIKQLEKVLYNAADNPQTVEALVKERIKAEAVQNEKLYGFDFKIKGASVSTNEIDDILKLETNLDKRLEVWSVSKEIGPTLKDGLVDLRRLRNETVRALGYPDYFAYQVSDYGMTPAELRALCLELNRQLRPLYRELHTYARYELAKKYGVAEVPDMLPAHWLPNRWGQDWNTMVTVEGLDLDGMLREKAPEWFPQQAERFYVSLAYPELPKSFWELSSLYPLPPDVTYKKNNHASAWHMDLAGDVRSLMSIVPNAEWYETVHHEFGHVYYYIQYSSPDVPIILREGANRGYHEAIGSLMGLAAMQKPFLAGLGLLPADAKTDDLQALLKEALNYVVFIPWSAGVMTEFENSLYAGELPPDRFNKEWWDLVAKYQGIVPPSPRGEEHCDAASKTHISDDAAQYYDYAISYVLLFQLHDHIARNILKQDPHATNYYGNKEVGDFLAKIMRPGQSGDWRQTLRDATGEDMSARAMLAYFEPLMEYLKKANEGRKHTLGDI